VQDALTYAAQRMDILWPACARELIGMRTKLARGKRS
jgi:hypothetical protein